MTNSYQKGCLKWPGAKATLLTRLFRTVPKEGGRLIEPFMGSAVFSLNTDYDEYVLADFNKDLVGFYQDLVKSPEELKVKALDFFARYNNKPDYYLIRSIFNDKQNGVVGLERSVIFIYLLRHGYKGLVRYSKRTGFNVPFGGYKRPYFPEEEMDFFANKFKKAKIIHSDFSALLSSLSFNTSDVVFNDPPYLSLPKANSFVHYTAEGFTNEQHEELNRLSVESRRQGARVYTCNHNVKLLDDLYTDYTDKKRFLVKRSISALAKKHKKAPEVLLSY